MALKFKSKELFVVITSTIFLNSLGNPSKHLNFKANPQISLFHDLAEGY